MLPESTPGKRYLYSLSLPRLQRYLQEISLFPPRELQGILDLDAASLAAAAQPFEDAIHKTSGLDALSRLHNLAPLPSRHPPQKGRPIVLVARAGGGCPVARRSAGGFRVRDPAAAAHAITPD